MKQFTVLCYLLLLSPIFFYGQNQYLGGQNYNYFIANSEPDSQWNQLSFDDSSWDQGYSVLGYGNSNDSTSVSVCNSLYVRMPFEIANKELIKKLELMIDYDDGFIAYLNGTEVVRVNLGKSGETIPYDGTATRSRDFISNRNMCTPLMGYFLDTTILKDLLIEGTNILSIQVHNDTLLGEDLGVAFALFNITNESYNPYSAFFKAIKQVRFDSTYLPVVKIYTNEYGIHSCDDKVDAFMQIVDSDSSYNKIDATEFKFSTPIGIEPRGQSSRDWPKKNYSVELRDSLGNDDPHKIMGMPKESDWVLSGPFVDRTLIRNALAYTLSEQLGNYAPRFRFCELFINDEYQGVYQFMEKIKRDADRVDIKKLTPENIVDVTGGYIIKYDKDVYKPGIVYPKSEDITIAQLTYIQAFHKSYVASLHDSVILNPERGYRKYVDTKSYIDFTIVNEIARNPDAYLYSTYMYKDSDDKSSKLHYGPVWDFDLAFGNSNFQNADKLTGWQFDNYSNRYLYQTKMFKDTALVHEFQNRWAELRLGILHPDSINATIDSLLAIVGPVIERNDDVWQIDNQYIMGVAWGHFYADNYTSGVEDLKDWVTNRTAWMDTEIKKLNYPYTYVPPISNSISVLENAVKIYPNPCVNYIEIKISLETATNVFVSLTSANGEVLVQINDDYSQGGEYIQTIDMSSLSSGMYTLKLKTDKGGLQKTIIKK